MKTSTATVHFKLRTQKVLSDGTSPIMLVVQWNGRKEKATGFSCTSEHWDNVNECFKKKMSNYIVMNKMLLDIKNEVIKKKLYYEQNKIDYNASMLLEKKQSTVDTKLFYNIAMNMCNERKLGLKRKLAIDTAFNSLSNYIGRKDILISELDNVKLIGYIKSLENVIATNTIINYVSTLFAIIQYALDNEIINVFPNKAKAYLKHKHSKTFNHRALNDDDIFKLRYYFNNMDGDIKDLYSKKFSLGLYLMSYGCFGLAPIDLLKLHQNQLSLVMMNDSPYYKIETNRSKTNRSVRVFVNKDIYEDIIEPFITKDRTHVLPIFNDGMDEKEMIRVSRNLNEVVNRHLKEIAEENNIPKFTLYSARHSFCSIAVKDGRNLGLIANAMGRNVTGMMTYIKNLNSDEDLITLA